MGGIVIDDLVAIGILALVCGMFFLIHMDVTELCARVLEEDASEASSGSGVDGG